MKYQIFADDQYARTESGLIGACAYARTEAAVRPGVEFAVQRDNDERTLYTAVVSGGTLRAMWL